MNRHRHGVVRRLLPAALLGAAPAALGAGDGPLTMSSLLEEMIDREAIARWPHPQYTTGQFSSFDRASVRAGEETWWANGDWGQFLRVEERDGRQEHVLMDVAGPGAIVRIWSANPPADGMLRIYIDGSAEPTVTAPMAEIVGGDHAVGEPLSAVRSRGWNLYLPIPYAGHCKVTCDKGGFYYQINHRTYGPGTKVESVTKWSLEEAADAVRRAQQTLAAPPAPAGERHVSLAGALEPKSCRSLDGPAGPASIRALVLHVACDDLEEALRTLILKIEFDGVETVWCPAGDFFGSGIGLNDSSDWWRTTEREAAWGPGGAGGAGSLSCRWVMPYRRTCHVSLENLGPRPLDVRLTAVTGPWSWDDRSMLFHARWRQQSPIPTQPRSDFNYVQVEGRGVFAGDTLALVNPVTTWWGEGDEKIYVDGEAFPSHFGTGTEDYYGYAWAYPDLFRGPFHSQSRCDGPGNYGHTTVSRVRMLDAIPFTKSLKFDMEVWHWKECDVSYAATSCFYALPGARHNRQPQPDEAARGVLDPPPLPPPYRIAGALEAEALRVVARSEGVPAVKQGGFETGLWSDERQLWVRAGRVGDFVELAVPAEGAGPRRLVAYATKSWDYAIVRFFVNGQPAGEGVDLFNTAGRAAVATGPIDLGVHVPKDGRFVLRIEVTGSNAKSEKPGTYFGLDCVVVAEP